MTPPPASVAGAQPNAGYTYHERLGPEIETLSLLTYLSCRHPHSTSAQWAARIAAGEVLIDGHPAQADSLLRRGSELVWQRPPWVEPAAPTNFDVLYEDADLLAVAKPAGLPTLPGANFLQATLLYQIQRCFPDATPLHRLGRWTSGLVLCARNRHARAALIRQWSSRTVGKRYRALISGDPTWDEHTIETPIGPVQHALLGSIHAATADGKQALSHVTVLERRADAALCDVRIVTGRPHQIRIHLAAAGHPLVGDPLYPVGGVPTPDTRALPGDPGYHLHAAELRFRHPVSGEDRVIACEPPPLLRC